MKKCDIYSEEVENHNFTTNCVNYILIKKKIQY